jgi:hypothetical protein
VRTGGGYLRRLYNFYFGHPRAFPQVLFEFDELLGRAYRMYLHAAVVQIPRPARHA